MRYVYLLISRLPAMLAAQDGAAIYKERCVSCHDAAESRAPKMKAAARSRPLRCTQL
jgi:predicted CXXCH cytochrome family protein